MKFDLSPKPGYSLSERLEDLVHRLRIDDSLNFSWVLSRAENPTFPLDSLQTFGSALAASFHREMQDERVRDGFLAFCEQVMPNNWGKPTILHQIRLFTLLALHVLRDSSQDFEGILSRVAFEACLDPTSLLVAARKDSITDDASLFTTSFLDAMRSRYAYTELLEAKPVSWVQGQIRSGQPFSELFQKLAVPQTLNLTEKEDSLCNHPVLAFSDYSFEIAFMRTGRGIFGTFEHAFCVTAASYERLKAVGIIPVTKLVVSVESSDFMQRIIAGHELRASDTILLLQ